MAVAGDACVRLGLRRNDACASGAYEDGRDFPMAQHAAPQSTHGYMKWFRFGVASHVSAPSVSRAAPVCPVQPSPGPTAVLPGQPSVLATLGADHGPTGFPAPPSWFLPLAPSHGRLPGREAPQAMPSPGEGQSNGIVGRLSDLGIDLTNLDLDS